MYYFRTIYSKRIAALALLDGACLIAAAFAAWHLVEPSLPPVGYAAATGLLTLAAFLAFAFTDAYHPSVASSTKRSWVSLLTAMGIACIPALLFYFFGSVPSDVKPAVTQAAALYLPALAVSRVAVPALWRSSWMSRSVLIVGASDLGLRIADHLRTNSAMGIDVAGFLSDELAYNQHDNVFEGYPVLGMTHHLEKVLDDQPIDLVVVASKNRGEHLPEDALQIAKMQGMQTESGLAFMEQLSGTLYQRDLRASYLIFSPGLRQGPWASAVKRGVDIVGSLLGLILASPLLLFFAIAIKLDSKGPVFFRQVRLGKDEKPFELIKLRSMTQNAEQETGAVFARQHDERVTRVGRILRPMRIDEVPQLWNVLRGEMSLVGPRAERPEFTEELKERYRFYWMRSSVKPGLSGWAQTRFGYVNDVESYESKLALDLYYIKHQSLFLDLVILLMTVRTVIRLRGL